MQRTPVNPWDWSLNFSYNQGEIIDGPLRQLICAGQTAVDGEGNPQHPNDMRCQIGLTLRNITRLDVFTTDVDKALKNFDQLGMRFEPVKCAPPMALIFASRTDLNQLTVFKTAVRALCRKIQEKLPNQTF